MTVAAALIAVAVLLALNGFFVLAEFAMVKLRPTQVEALIEAGSVRARLVRHVQEHLDDYLSVCQLGITLASIALGFVGEPAFAALLEPYLGSWAWAHLVSLGFAYVMVSFLHVLLGEQVPKLLAIRAPAGSAIAAAPFLRVARAALLVPLWLLRVTTQAVLWLIGFASPAREPLHTEA